MSETACPLCSTPRPRGANKCACNYTFEYDEPRVTSLPRVRRDGTATAAVVAAAAIAAAVAFLIGRGFPTHRGDDEIGGLLIAIGLFSLAGAGFEWRWFMSSRRAGPFRAAFGYTGARIAYGLLGGAFVGAGLWLATS